MKATKSSLKNKLDRLVSLIVRSVGQCQRCGNAEYEKLQCCHIYSRTYNSVRWDLDNLICMCASCHFYTHKNPIEFSEFVTKHLGAEKYQQLKMRRNSEFHYKIHDLEDLYKSLIGLKERMYVK